MMKVRNQNLYSVDIGRTIFYVVADDTTAAAQKAEDYVDSITNESLITTDGSLQPSNRVSIHAIRMVADKIVY